MSNNINEVDILANRLNYDAIVFKGCTAKEIRNIVLVCFGISSLLLGTASQIVTGNFIWGVAIGILSTIGLTWISMCVLEKVRRGQEPGYLQQLIRLKLDKSGLFGKSEIIRRSGTWMIGRKL